VRILHLSDIHLNGTAEDALDLTRDVRDQLERDLQRKVAETGPIDIIAITGDIAYSGSTDDYDAAERWIGDIQLITGAESVLIVPGNHDVRRDVTDGETLTSIHQSIRALPAQEATAQAARALREPEGHAHLFAPLDNYRAFARKYECDISTTQPFWERSIDEDGSSIKLRGMTSVLVSDRHDQKANLLLGNFQSRVQVSEQQLCITLCHHPTDWLIDGDEVSDDLQARANLQLFGHKHRHRMRTIEQSLVCVAGAVHPEPGGQGQDWVPSYQVLTIVVSNREWVCQPWVRSWSDRYKRFDDFPVRGAPFRLPVSLADEDPPSRAAPPGHDDFGRANELLSAVPDAARMKLLRDAGCLPDEPAPTSEELLRAALRQAADKGALVELVRQTEKLLATSA
jgi:predicted MPP superfamily phosphohydrolase